MAGSRDRGWFGVILSALVLVGAAGCGGGGSGVTVLVNKPDWAYERYQRIAVLETRCSDPRARSHADHLTARLTEILANNGTFTVVEKERFRDLMTEQDLSRLADVANPDSALPEGAIEVAQVLVLPALTTFDLKATRVDRRQPVYGTDRRGRLVQTGERIVPVYTHGARVSGTVRVVDAATGRTLTSHTVTNLGDETSRSGGPPKESPEDIATAAVDLMSVEFVRRIAPTRVEVEFDSNMLVVALEYRDGRYVEASRLPWNAEQVIVAARELPRECVRNDFKLELETLEGRRLLGEASFTWNGSAGKRGEVLVVPADALRDSGEVEFVAKLFATGDDEPVLTREFSLIPPKQ
ncbi:MAG: hypothetical protein IPM64_11485 [Phycisphaerales bacterium]|nr:hypothetical protein [Phycisphaerales bacterium]